MIEPRPRRCARALRATAIVGAALAVAPARADEVLVAAAANFAVPLSRIGASFTASTGHVLKVAAGATGRLYSQIAAGAPFDVLLAADDATPKRLVAEGHAVAGSAFTYALGKLVLWSARPGVVDAQGAVLTTGRFAHLAIANPKLAPYGAAAIDVLKARGLFDALAPKFVTAESVAQAYQFVATGNAELGFVALSQVAAPGQPAHGSYWIVPDALHREMRQDAVLLKPGAAKPAAAALLAYLKGDAARSLIRAYGYGT